MLQGQTYVYDVLLLKKYDAAKFEYQTLAYITLNANLCCSRCYREEPNPKIHLMKQLIVAASLLLSSFFIFAQDITGLWKGTMYNDSTKKALPYELLMKKEKGKYTGMSYSWFLVDGKVYYGIKKVKVSVAKDHKIVIEDAVLVENNYPNGPDKNVRQLNILDLVNQENEDVLDGLFVTNNTKRYRELTGHINVTKTNTFTESSLMQYQEKKGTENTVAVVK